MNRKDEIAQNVMIALSLFWLLFWGLYNHLQIKAYKHYTGKTAKQMEQMLLESKCESGACELVVKVQDKHIKYYGGRCRKGGD